MRSQPNQAAVVIHNRHITQIMFVKYSRTLQQSCIRMDTYRNMHHVYQRFIQVMRCWLPVINQGAEVLDEVDILQQMHKIRHHQVKQISQQDNANQFVCLIDNGQCANSYAKIDSCICVD